MGHVKVNCCQSSIAYGASQVIIMVHMRNMAAAETVSVDALTIFGPQSLWEAFQETHGFFMLQMCCCLRLGVQYISSPGEFGPMKSIGILHPLALT